MKPTLRLRHSLIALATGCAAMQISYAQTVEVDPATPIPANYGSAIKEYEFSGDAGGWKTVDIDSVTVTGGALTGTTTNGDPQFTKNVPVVELGYGTIVEFAISVDPGNPAVAAGGGNLFYGDFAGGIAGGKNPGFSVPEDGALHVVRVTFPGGVKNLNTLRIDPTSGGFPKTVALDYLRIYGYQPTSFTDVTLTADDGPSSYNSAGNWDSGAAPTTESNYFTGPYILRTPAGGTFTPFGGSALTIDNGGSLYFKSSGGQEIRKLTLDGGSLAQAATGASPDTAKLFVPDGIDVTAASKLDAVDSDRTLEITGSFSGSEPLTVAGNAIGPVAGKSPGKIVLKSDNSAYTGTITVGSNSWLDLDHDNAVAGADVIVENGSRVRRDGADANGTTTAHSWSLSGRGNLSGNEGIRGALYFNKDALNATIVGDIAISGTGTRIGEYSAGGSLTLNGDLSGSGTLELWGGGGSESHIQTFVLNGASTIAGGTDVLSEFGSQTHLRLGGDDRLATDQRLRLNATWGASPDGAGVFLDLNGFNQTLARLQLDGSKKKVLEDTSGSGNSVLTLTNDVGAFDANGGSVFISGIAIKNTGGSGDSGVYLDNGSVITLTDATWDSSFYTTLGFAGDGTLVLVNSDLTFGGELLMARGTSNGTLTVDAASSASTPNFFRIGDNPTGAATVNLNGGTLAAKRFYNNNTGSGILNLDGGTLRATGDNLAACLDGSLVSILSREAHPITTFIHPTQSMTSISMVHGVDAGQHFEQQVFVNHDAPRSKSRVSYRGALQGKDARPASVAGEGREIKRHGAKTGNAAAGGDQGEAGGVRFREGHAGGVDLDDQRVWNRQRAGDVQVIVADARAERGIGDVEGEAGSGSHGDVAGDAAVSAESADGHGSCAGVIAVAIQIERAGTVLGQAAAGGGGVFENGIKGTDVEAIGIHGDATAFEVHGERIGGGTDPHWPENRLR